MPANRVEPVEAIASYAHRAKGTVRLVLQLPGAEPTDGANATVRLAGQRGTVRAKATVTATDPGVRVEATVPAKELPPDIWRIAVRLDPEGPFLRVQARLLTSRTQPIALLPGPVPPRQIDAPRARTQTGSSRLVQRAGRVVDLVLKRLPEERAARYRTSLRRSARRVLG